MITGSTTFSCPSSVLSRTVGDEIVILDMNSQAYFGLDEVGACIFQAIQDGSDFDGVVARVLSEFDGTAADEVRSDATELIGSLVAQGLLELNEPLAD